MELTPEDKQRIYEEEKARLEAQDQLKTEKAQQEAQSTLGCCVAVIVVVVLFAMWMVFTGPSSEETKVADRRRDAWYVACQFVEDRLKAPSSADFPYYEPKYVQDLGSGKYRVQSYVDAQNSFGAKIRSRWMVVEQHVGGTQFKLLDIAINSD